ncbi:hypothetical protein CLMAG_11590 [Clostridium magnum DSM 2767]|uniref:Uncharacterized protein n=1 Tax=Clostridium magnum DSM 2767 TaxID=1121326 RepID=A0A161XHG8_9CLOT|nr:hypothetical protein CLMAG_11590 [Clostridium magnum DSM 2767]
MAGEIAIGAHFDVGAIPNLVGQTGLSFPPY